MCVECAVVNERFSETGEGHGAERVVRRVTGRFADGRPVIVRAAWMELAYTFIDGWFQTQYTA